MAMLQKNKEDAKYGRWQCKYCHKLCGNAGGLAKHEKSHRRKNESSERWDSERWDAALESFTPLPLSP